MRGNFFIFRLFSITLPLLLFLVSITSALQCIRGCICKWSHGKVQADCSNSAFSTIPVSLSHETQTLILDDNPLRRLESDVFLNAGLINLQKISLRNCQLDSVSENAFRGLKILGELDVSYNNISEIHSKTFEGNHQLSILKLSQNPLKALKAYQFPYLERIKSIDLSKCDISFIHSKAFKNLESTKVETIRLNENSLQSLPLEVFFSLRSLQTLSLFQNPWNCDCNLQSFRDWVMSSKLYSRPTACSEPERLHSKLWDEIHPSDFACKPSLSLPATVIFGGFKVNVTLPCHVSGSPSPQVRWVVDGKILNNNTRASSLSETLYIISEEKGDGDSFNSRWYNLSIRFPSYEDVGDYTCVAENNGGVMEKVIRLSFEDPSSSLEPEEMEMAVIIGATTAALLFLVLLLLLLFLSYCFCRSRSKREKGKERGESLSNDVKASESRQLLLPPLSSSSGLHSNPLPKPPRVESALRSYGDKYEVEMSELRSFETGSQSRGSFISGDTYPDLLDIPNRCKHSSSPTESGGSTMPDTSRLIHHHHVHHHIHPLNAVHLNGSFLRSGTLPHRHSSTFSVSSSSPQQQVLLPVLHPIVQSRPGYITLPRRQKGSFSSPSPSSSSRDPIYDGVGPRTSADGSSKLSLRPNGSVRPNSNPRYTLPPYYAPIEEMSEIIMTTNASSSSSPPPLPPCVALHNQSTPNLTSFAEASHLKSGLTNVSNSSDTTLLEENLSSYCEPFGKAYLPETNPRNSLSSSGESEGLPPRTLPKPKIKPLPPPKPKTKSYNELNVAVVFQDEGIDGSEV